MGSFGGVIRRAVTIRKAEAVDTQFPQSLVYRPTWNTKRTIQFLSVRKWRKDQKHAQSVAFREAKNSGDESLEDLVSQECAATLIRTFGSFEGFSITSAPTGRSAGERHFATESAKKIAIALAIPYIVAFAPSEKKTKGVVTEIEAKMNVRLLAEDLPERLILFDDVSTTGTTLEGCKAALGSRYVIALAWLYGG